VAQHDVWRAVSRYVPNAQLAFEYPDDSYKELGAAAPLGSDGNLLMRDDPMSQVVMVEHRADSACASWRRCHQMDHIAC